MKSQTLENRITFQNTILRIGKVQVILELDQVHIRFKKAQEAGMCQTIPNT